MAAPGERRALITGIGGQDGSFLAELLLERGYEVIGTTRPNGAGSLGVAEHLREQVDVLEADLLDTPALTRVVADTRPAELYHLAAPSFVPETWGRPAETIAAIAAATAALLEAVRDHSPATRIFLAGSSTMFGATSESPQSEETPCRPQNPYAVAKLAAQQIVGRLRDHEGLFACTGILYNHESERRPERFVTRKISRGVAAIKAGVQDELVLGDLDAVRDWSFAGDTMLGAWLMLQHDEPADYILASGVGHTVGEFAERAFAHVGLAAADHLRSDPGLVRAREPAPLIGDASRARERLGWSPAVRFEALVARMVEADLAAVAAPHSSFATHRSKSGPSTSGTGKRGNA